VVGERNPQAAAIAVPVLGLHHRFMGALGVIAALSRTDQDGAEEIRDILLARAAALSATLGGTTGMLSHLHRQPSNRDTVTARRPAKRPATLRGLLACRPSPLTSPFRDLA
jgi:hypothetical protein